MKVEADFLFIFLSLTAPKAYSSKIKIKKKLEKPKLLKLFVRIFFCILNNNFIITNSYYEWYFSCHWPPTLICYSKQDPSHSLWKTHPQLLVNSFVCDRNEKLCLEYYNCCILNSTETSPIFLNTPRMFSLKFCNFLISGCAITNNSSGNQRNPHCRQGCHFYTLQNYSSI